MEDRSGRKEDWTAFLSAWYEHLNRFSDDISAHVDEAEIPRFLTSLVVPVIRNHPITIEQRVDFFCRLQALGWHLLPAHFYSPVPDTSSLPPGIWESRFDDVPGWSLNDPVQFDILSTLAQFASELEELRKRSDDPDAFDWNNNAFNAVDASLYYGMIRLFKPARIIEVGAGHSTCIAALAAIRNGATALEAIEPYPQPFLVAGRPGLQRLIQQPVQSVPAAAFSVLEANDILFVDSSHVCKVGSDVNYLILQILPRLKPGVIVHFHDIFLPWNMPREWIEKHHLFWNEQYLLLAFLQGNKDFEVILASHYLGQCHPERLKQAFPYLDISRQLPGGGSFWIRRIGGVG